MKRLIFFVLLHFAFSSGLFSQAMPDILSADLFMAPYIYKNDGVLKTAAENALYDFEEFEIEYTGSTLWGGASWQVRVDGNYAYFVVNNGLMIFDISDNANPTVVSQLYLGENGGTALDVFISDNYAYIANRITGLKIIDISNPSSPYVAGSIDTPGSARGVYVMGDYAYVADGESGIQIIDISNPASPVLTGSCSTWSAQGIYVIGSYSYVADRDSGLQIIDIGNPSLPYVIGGIVTPGIAQAIFVSGNYAYVAANDSGLQIIDISNPSFPTYSGGYDTPGYARKIYVSGSSAYVGDDMDGGVQIIDISNPSSPALAGYYDTLDHARGIHVIDSCAYVADGDAGLLILNISNPSSPQVLGSYDAPRYIQKVLVREDFAYVAGWESGVHVIDISNPSLPLPVGHLDTPHNTLGICISGDYAYVADGGSGLLVIDISVASSPTLVGSYDTPGFARGVYISGDYAYVADGSSGLQVINISTPSFPTFVGSYDTPGSARGVYVSGNYAYLADAESGLQIIEVSTPSSPSLVGSYDTQGTAWELYASGNYAYVADGTGGLLVFDISTPSSPWITGSASVPFNDFRGMYVSGNYVCVVSYNPGFVLVLDLSTPSSPLIISDYDTPGFSNGVFVNGNYIYVADMFSLLILKSALNQFRISIPDSVLVGQDAFPGDTISFPVSIQLKDMVGTAGIFSFQMELTYDDSKFACIGYDSVGTLLTNQGGLGDFTVWFRKDSGSGILPDTLRIAAANKDSLYQSGLPLFDKPLINLKFRIPTSVYNNDSTVIHFNRFMFNEGMPGAFTNDGSIKIQLRHYGDVDQNGVVQPFDAVLVLRHVIKDTVISDDGLIAAEVSGNGEITAYDAALILMYYVGKITSFPVGDYFKRALPSNRGAELALECGELQDGMMTLLVNARNLTEVYGYSMELAYDPAALVFQGAGLTDFTQGMINVVKSENGTVRIAAAGTDPIEGEGALVRLTFRVTGEVSGEDLIQLTEMILNEELVLSNASSVSVPKTYALEQNYPNPFNPTTRIRYQIPEAAQVQILIYNTLGQRVRTLINEQMSAGAYEIIWDGTNDNGVKLASGVYIYRMKAGSFNQIRKLVLVK